MREMAGMSDTSTHRSSNVHTERSRALSERIFAVPCPPFSFSPAITPLTTLPPTASRSPAHTFVYNATQPLTTPPAFFAAQRRPQPSPTAQPTANSQPTRPQPRPQPCPNLRRPIPDLHSSLSPLSGLPIRAHFPPRQPTSPPPVFPSALLAFSPPRYG